MAKVIITTMYCEVVDELEITFEHLEFPLSSASFLCDLKDALRRADKMEREVGEEAT